LSREYGVDPLESMMVAQAMQTDPVVLTAIERGNGTWAAALQGDTGESQGSGTPRRQRLYPVVDEAGRLTGVITRRKLAEFAQQWPDSLSAKVLPYREAEVSFANETLRSVAERMARAGIMSMPVIEVGSRKVLGLITLEDMLQARGLSHERETKQVRVRRLRIPSFRERGTSPPNQEELESTT
jgi:chloride channel protein, CIC family